MSETSPAETMAGESLCDATVALTVGSVAALQEAPFGAGSAMEYFQGASAVTNRSLTDSS